MSIPTPPAPLATYHVALPGETLCVTLHQIQDGAATLQVGEHTVSVTGTYRPGAALQEFTVNGVVVRFRLDQDAGRLTLARRGRRVTTRALSALEHELYALMPEKQAADASNLLASPMPGKVIALYVEAGQAIKAGQALCVIEAMKMENVLHAERDATIAEVSIQTGQTVDADQVLIQFAARA